MLFFFFKQKTAYEVRISDWSSDVCSSDLRLGDAVGVAGEHDRIDAERFELGDRLFRFRAHDVGECEQGARRGAAHQDDNGFALALELLKARVGNLLAGAGEMTGADDPYILSTDIRHDPPAGDVTHVSRQIGSASSRERVYT